MQGNEQGDILCFFCRAELFPEDPKLRIGSVSKMDSILRSTMTGPIFHSWHYQTGRMRTACLLIVEVCSRCHSSLEDFSYFTLRRRPTSSNPPTSVFGISCTRQMDANDLLSRPVDVTRSTVQKAVVAIADSPQSFGHLREKLSMVTGAWFAQRYDDEIALGRFRPLMDNQGLYRCRYTEGR